MSSSGGFHKFKAGQEWKKKTHQNQNSSFAVWFGTLHKGRYRTVVPGFKCSRCSLYCIAVAPKS